MTLSLADLGWSSHFAAQLAPDDLQAQTPARIISVHRNRYVALSCSGQRTLTAKADIEATVTVGDWVLADDDGQIQQVFERKTSLSRRASGEDARQQLIAANVDVLFITTSCNDDFNPARLERYLVLASAAGCMPVIVLTKPDLCDEPEKYAKRARALGQNLPVLTLDAHDPIQAAQMFDYWGKGQTAALLGSSGVGKSTLSATLTGQQIATQAIREDDAKGRHTTTTRNLYQATHGGWILDTPGMRSLRLKDVSEGIDQVFADLTTLAQDCRFRDCAHDREPGCAIQAEITAGRIDPARLRRWQKLDAEDQRNSQTLAQSRSRDKALGKYYNSAIKSAKSRKNR